MEEVSMNLTTEQIHAIKEGKPVRVIPPEVGQECVVLRADVYQRADRLLHDFDPSLAYPAIDEAWREGGTI
jgi:hypothetical protein